MIEEIVKIFNRDIDRLKNEIALFNHEDNLWRTTGSIKNTAGNLCLHLVGNLNTYIGKNMGGTGYIRNRDAEFSLKNIPKEDLVRKVGETRDTVSQSLSKMSKSQLEEIYVEDILGYKMTNGFFLIHLSGHLSYHLGQINYIRRVFE
jgi:hypothetical protein